MKRKERKPLSGKAIKNLGIVAALVGAGASLLGSFVDDRKTESRITEKVNEAVAKALEKKEE